MSFHSYFWNGAALDSTLAAALERFLAHESRPDERLQAFEMLLDSDSTPARGIALDQYTFAQGQGRMGGVDLLARVAPRVRERLVSELQAPPFVRPEPDAHPHVGANHASAFYAMWHHARAEDGPLVARALAANSEPDVLQWGVKAAEVVLDGEPVLEAQLASELRRLVNAHELPAEVRAGAITALGVCASEDVVPWLLDALRDPELRVAAAAARCLLERAPERFRGQITPFAATWPTSEESVPYDVTAVRELLDE
jgi:hypothetical protein